MADGWGPGEGPARGRRPRHGFAGRAGPSAWAGASLGAGALLVVAVATIALAGPDPAASASPEGGAGPGGGEADEVTVFAAASLTEAFRDVGRAFREVEGGRAVVLNLAGSQALAAQIVAGAPADVFASADAVQMERVGGEGLLAGSPTVFAENGLAVIAEPGNPRGIRELADLARPDLTVVLAAPEVPVGRYSRAALEEAGVRVQPASLETDVKQVLAKVALGEADAGIVYRTDVRAARGSVTGIPFPGGAGPRARYEIAILDEAREPEAARRFVDFLGSAAGRRILRSHGFEAPGGTAQVSGGPDRRRDATGLRDRPEPREP